MPLGAPARPIAWSWHIAGSSRSKQLTRCFNKKIVAFIRDAADPARRSSAAGDRSIGRVRAPEYV